MPSIVSIGEAIVEIMRTDRDAPLDRAAEFVGPYPSGAPAIFASAAARLGADVGFVGSVGRDPFGDCVWNRLSTDGMDLSAVMRLDARLTGIAFVAYRSDGSRTFVFHLAHSAAALVDWGQIPEGFLGGARYLHVMGSALSCSEAMRQTCYRAAREVSARGGVVSLDPNLRPELLPVEEIRGGVVSLDPNLRPELLPVEEIRDICQPILDVCRMVFPSGEEAVALTGAATADDAAVDLLRRGVEIVALKRGVEGSTVYTPDGTLEVPAYQVDEVDPTGAGDCYDAAFVVGLAEGWDLARVGRFANAVGALATTRMGPMEGTFTREEVARFMASQGRVL